MNWINRSNFVAETLMNGGDGFHLFGVVGVAVEARAKTVALKLGPLDLMLIRDVDRRETLLPTEHTKKVYTDRPGLCRVEHHWNSGAGRDVFFVSRRKRRNKDEYAIEATQDRFFAAKLSDQCACA